MSTETAYNDFIEKYKDYPKQLASIVASECCSYAVSQEDGKYNLGTMQKDGDIDLSNNIVIANANKFKSARDEYKNHYPLMSDDEAQARVVFDFLRENGSNFYYDRDKDDILFGDVKRKHFYSKAIYKNALSNTNFFDRYIGNMQILCLEPKSVDGLPRAINGLPQETIDKFKNIPSSERFEILHKRGLYHESVHMAMGTTDERKCDTFALLKIMQEHPKHAKNIFDIYNMQRSKIGYTISTMHGFEKDSTAYKRAIKDGTMTYMMPNTYKKLEEYALNPGKIPNNDSDLLKLTCSLTAEVEFSKEHLAEFAELMTKKNITTTDLSNNNVVQICMQQGGFNAINAYINSDKRLKDFVDKQQKEKKSKDIALKFANLKKKIQDNRTKAPYKPQDISKVDLSTLRYIQAKKTK